MNSAARLGGIAAAYVHTGHSMNEDGNSMLLSTYIPAYWPVRPGSAWCQLGHVNITEQIHFRSVFSPVQSSSAHGNTTRHPSGSWASATVRSEETYPIPTDRTTSTAPRHGIRPRALRFSTSVVLMTYLEFCSSDFTRPGWALRPRNLRTI